MILRMARRRSSLPDPADYYAGAPGWTGEPPRNILVFDRRSAREAAAGGVQMHPRHVLCLCRSGAGVLMADGALHALQPGRGFLLFPFQQHHLSGFASAAIDWLFVSFDLPESPALAPLRDHPFRLSPRARAYLDRAVAAFHEHARGHLHRGADITAWTMLMLGALAENARGAERAALDRIETPDTARLHRAVRHIYARLREPFRVEACARAANLSASHLRRLFRRRMGCSLGRYVRQARLHRASELLHLTDRSVTEIAEACGFGSVYAFSRAFAAAHGHPPTAHRTRLRRSAAGASPRRGAGS